MSKRRLSNVSQSESSSESDCTMEMYTMPKRQRTSGKYSISGYNSENLVPEENFENVPSRKPTRLPKCSSRNAVMARQNRMKKKQYIENLEQQMVKLRTEVKTLKSITNNQSHVIIDFRKQVKYLKSVIANSTTINSLLRPIAHNIKENEDKLWNSYHVRSETVPYPDWPTPDPTDGLTDFTLDDTLLPVERSSRLSSSSDLPDIQSFNISDDDFPLFDEDAYSTEPNTRPNKRDSFTLDEHNYTAKVDIDSEDEDVGVCLHISKQKISLEFCPKCHENASQAWTEME